MITKVEIELKNGTTVKLTVEEAETLFNDLKKLFGKEVTYKWEKPYEYPWWQPYEYPWWSTGTNTVGIESDTLKIKC